MVALPDPVLKHVEEGAVVVHRLSHHRLTRPFPVKIRIAALAIWRTWMRHVFKKNTLANRKTQHQYG
jgi:hypothetical protein